MSLLTTVLKGVDRAKEKTKSLFTDFVTTVRTSETYDPTTGQVSAVETTKNVSGMVDEWGFGEVDGSTVLLDDLKIFTFDATTEIEQSDQVTFKGNKYSVVNIFPIMAGPRMVARYLQLRQ